MTWDICWHFASSRRLDSSRIILITRHISHHGGHSGYHRLCAYLPEARVIQPPAARRFRGATRLKHWISRRVSPRYYNWPDTVAELRAFVRSLPSGALWHFLYGEDQLGCYHYLAPIVRAKVVATIHQPPAHAGLLLKDYEAWRSLDGIVALASNQLAHAARHAPRAATRVIPHGVDTEFFTPRSLAPASGVGAPLRVLVVGQWLRDLPAAVRIATQLGGSRFTFRYIGSTDSAAMFSGMGIRAESGVSDESLREAYRTSDLLWLPLVDATANNALLEALACGLPVLAPRLPALAEYDRGGVFFHPPGEDPVRALSELRDQSSVLASARTPARLAAENFAWPRIASALRTFYAEIRHAEKRA